MRILGIDPGLGIVGYGLVETEPSLTLLDCGIVSTPKEDPDSKRLQTIREDLLNLLNETKPELIAIEKLYFTKNITAIIQVSQARGVILEAITSYQPDLPIIEVNPSQLKQIILGDGKAKKKEMQQEIARIFQLEKIIKPDDANDAVAIAIAGNRLKAGML